MNQSSHISVDALMARIGTEARAAARALALAPAAAKQAALQQAARCLREQADAILAANAADMEAARAAGVTGSFLDRLLLDAGRVAAMAEGVETVAALPDPVGAVRARWQRPNGLVIERVATPLGVIGVIFESRPNVTADAASLCLKAGNAVILRSGSDAFRSAEAIAACMASGLEAAGLPATAAQLVPTRDRAAVGAMLAGLGGNLDVIVPRGGKSLVARVQDEARVPVFAHLEGVNHVYLHASAAPAMAEAIVLNAKMRRTGVCGAAETILIDAGTPDGLLATIVNALQQAGCEVRGDARVQAVNAAVVPATETDWMTEYLAPVVAIRVVDGLDAAIAHVERYGSRHTDAIIAEDQAAAERFLAEVDSAIVLHNASTQFADGGEFGFGAEIGIATGRMHARGPVGVEQLTSFNYRVRGTGQTRP